MNMARVMACCAALLGGMLASPAFAQDQAPGVSRVSSGFVPNNPFDTHFRVRSDIGDGRGYDNGFTTFSGLTPFVISPDSQLFWVDVRGYVPYTGEFGGNIGGGYRYYSPEIDYVFGVGGWYDHDNNGFRKYDQSGVSFEALGPFVDFRSNIYLPSNKDPNVLSSTFGGTAFSGNNILALFNQRAESIYTGGDFEVGGALPGLGDYGIRTYAGGYYAEARDQEPIYGSKARIEALVTEDLALETSVTNDATFGTRVQMGITWLFGSGKPVRWFTRQPTVHRLYAQQERNYRVMTHQYNRTASQVALKANGTPFFISFIDNTAAAGGSGTFEAPLNGINGASDPNADIVFIRRGDGTANNYNAITLQDNQKLFGDGGFGSVTTANLGTIALPFTPGPYPIFGGPITLANNNEVAFLTLQGANAKVVGSGIGGYNLHDLNVNNSLLGFDLTNNVGSGVIQRVSITNTTNGIVVNDTVGPFNLVLDQVRTSGGVAGLRVVTDGTATDTVAITNSNFSGASNVGAGFSTSGGGTQTINSSRNSFSNNSTGVQVNATPGNLTFNSTNDIINNNTQNGLSVNAGAGGTATTNVVGSSLTANGANGALFTAATGGTLSPTFTGATILRNGANGVLFDLGMGVPLAPVFNNTDVSGNRQNGVQFILPGGNAVNGTIANSMFNDNARNGLFVQAVNGTVNYTITNSSFSGNTSGSGINASLTNTPGAFLLSNSMLNNNALNGALFDVLGGSSLTNTFTNSQIINNLQNGVVYNTSAGAVVISTFNQSQVNGNAMNGAVYNLVAAATVNGTYNNSLFDSNTMNGLMFNAVSGGTVTNMFTNSSASGNTGGNGVSYNLRNVALTSVFSNSRFNTNGINGILVTGPSIPGQPPAATDSSVNFTGTGSTFSNNGASGIDVALINTGMNSNSSIFNFTGNTFDTNAVNGFRLLQLGAAGDSTVVFQQNLFNNNQNGLFLDRRDLTRVVATVGGTDSTAAQVALGNMFTRNTVSGFRFDAGGNSNQVNTVSIFGNLFDANRDGQEYNLSADGIVVASSGFNTYTSQTNDAVYVQTLNASSFGTIGQQSVFDGELISGTTNNGFEIRNNVDTLEPSQNAQLAFQNVLISGVSRRTTISGGINGIQISDQSELRTANSIFTIQGTDITGASADGIHAALLGSDDMTLQIGSLTDGQNVTIANSGDDGIEVVSTGGRQQFFDPQSPTFFQTGVQTINIQGSAATPTTITNSGITTGSGNTDATRGDGVSIVQTSNAVDGNNAIVAGNGSVSNVVASIDGVQSTFNAGRGLNIDVRSVSRVFNQYNVGTNVGNVFSNNLLQGVVFQSVAPYNSFTTTLAGNSPDANSIPGFRDIPDVPNNVNPPVVNNNPTSTPGGGYYLDRNANMVVLAGLDLRNNEIRNNGSFGTGSDGVVIATGTNTYMQVNIAGNMFGGNNLFDVNIQPIFSLNPELTSGVNNIALDPAARLDIAFGVNSTGNAQIPNFGDRVFVTTLGVAPLPGQNTPYLGSTVGSRFTNADQLKTANRPVVSVIRVYVDGLLGGPGDPNGNQFVQGGNVQDIQATFAAQDDFFNTYFFAPSDATSLIQFQPQGSVFPPASGTLP